jgi:mono/diheme cytochrome c family protein
VKCVSRRALMSASALVESRDPTSTIRVILEGARTVATDVRPTPSTIPAFGWKLGNEQIAAVATYMRNSWGNSAPAVTADQVKTLRNNLTTTGRAPPGEKQ